jgi:hypothetical protein
VTEEPRQMGWTTIGQEAGEHRRKKKQEDEDAGGKQDGTAVQSSGDYLEAKHPQTESKVQPTTWGLSRAARS